MKARTTTREIKEVLKRAMAAGLADDPRVKMLQQALEARKLEVFEVQHEGSMYEVGRAEAFGMMDNDGPWCCVCVEHSTIVHTPAKADALWVARHPEAFCMECHD